jgi:thioesterase domain-containing protein
MMTTHPAGPGPTAEEIAEPTTDEVYVLPVSVAQQRFWILDQMEPGNTSLNMPLAFQLTGVLDVAALEDSFNEIIARHEMLRTTFVSEEEGLMQVIAPELLLQLEQADISELPEAERQAAALQIRVEEAHSTFRLDSGPLLKAKLVRLGPTEHILLITMHHIICDGWSNGVLVRELGEIYGAFSQRAPSPLADLPIQYADFALWQQEWLESQSFDEQLSYWKQQLGSELPRLELPSDFPRQRRRSSFGAIESLLLSRSLTRALKALSQREDVTPFMLFLAAYQLLLHRYSQQREILVGSPTANRLQSETEGLIGAFANTLLLKTDFSGDPTFRELLQRVKEMALGAFSNQSLPLEKLIEEIKPAQARSGKQLFQALFIYQTAFMQPVHLQGLSITPMRSVSPGSIFEISLGVVEREEGVRLQLEYNTDLFEAETVKRLLGHLRNILQAVVIDIRQKVSEIALLSAAEEEVLLLECHRTEAELRTHPGVLEARVLPRGGGLAAYVSLRAGGAVDEPALRALLAERTATGKPPLSFFILSSLPLTAQGGIDETALLTAESHTPSHSPAILEQTEEADNQIESELKEIWKELLGIKSVGVRDDFFALGGHSLAAAKLFEQIRKRLGVNLPLVTMLRATTIEQLARVIGGDKPKAEWSSLVAIQPQGSKPPLFVVHAAGGNVLFYKDLAARLGMDQPVYGLQPKGLDGNQKVHSRIEEMAAHYLQEIKQLQPQGPYCFGGTSFGGLVAYEMAIQLRQRGEATALVALFDTYAPGYPKFLPGRSKLRNRFSQLGRRIEHHIESLRMLEPSERWSYIVAKTTKAKNQLRRGIKDARKSIKRGVLTTLRQPLPEALKQTQSTIFIAARAYRPQPYAGEVTLFRADRQPAGIYPDPALGWDKLVTGRLNIHEVPGSHGTIVVEPRVRYLVKKLEPCLESAVSSEVGVAER